MSSKKSKGKSKKSSDGDSSSLKNSEDGDSSGVGEKYSNGALSVIDFIEKGKSDYILLRKFSSADF